MPLSSSSRMTSNRAMARTQALTCCVPTVTPRWRSSAASLRENSVVIRRLSGAFAPAGLPEQGLDQASPQGLDIIMVFQEYAGGLLDVGSLEDTNTGALQGTRPVDRLGEARNLLQFLAPHRLHESGRLLSQRLAELRHLEPDDLQLLLEARIRDPKVQAPAAQRIRQLAGAVRCQDHIRRMRRANGAELRDRELVLRQGLEQQCLEFLVRPVDLIEQQHRAPLGEQGLQDGALQQVFARIEVFDAELALLGVLVEADAD